MDTRSHCGRQMPGSTSPTRRPIRHVTRGALAPTVSTRMVVRTWPTKLHHFHFPGHVLIPMITYTNGQKRSKQQQQQPRKDYEGRLRSWPTFV